jgi:type I restriction enzyme, S subunit
LLHDLLTRGIGPDDKLRPSPSQKPDSYKVSPIGLIPLEWSVRSLKSLGSIQSGATPSRERMDRYFDTEGTPWVKTLDLNEDLIIDTQERVTLAALRETSCSVMPVGAVLIAMYGGWEQIGRASLLATYAATNQAISSLVIDDGNIVPEYVLRALQQGRSRWKKIAASTRKDPNITKADVEDFLIGVPPTTEEQSAIVSRFRGVMHSLVLERSELTKLQSTKCGLMDDLLTGRVRVTSLLEK